MDDGFLGGDGGRGPKLYCVKTTSEVEVLAAHR